MTFINKYNKPNLDGLKESDIYTYNSTTRIVDVLDDDIKKIVSIYNETINKTLYIIGNEEFSGISSSNTITYTNVVVGVSDNDTLYILYKPIESVIESSTEKSILEEQKKTNKLLKKIYNPI